MCTRYENTMPFYRKDLYICIFWYLWDMLNQISFDVRRMTLFGNTALGDKTEWQELCFQLGRWFSG